MLTRPGAFFFYTSDCGGVRVRALQLTRIIILYINKKLLIVIKVVYILLTIQCTCIRSDRFDGLTTLSRVPTIECVYYKLYYIMC